MNTRVLLLLLLLLVLVECAYPPGQSETYLLLLCIVISRLVPQPNVFLLPVQSVGALTSLTKIVLCLLISVSFFQTKYFSLFLSLLFVVLY
jgi:hypothetical protein